MALIKTIDEVKNQCSIIELNMNILSLASYIGSAEKYIKECLGSALYTALGASYNGTIAVPYIALLPYVQKPLANIALYYWINGGQLQVNDKGVQIDHSGASKTAFQWQIDAWKADLEQDGFNGLDELLQFLQDNKATYTTWVADTNAFTINKAFFNPDAVSFHKILAIDNSHRTFKALSPYIQQAHDMELKAMLGDTFYDELKAALLADSLTADQKLLVPNLKKMEVYYGMAKAVENLRFTVKNNGLRIFETLSTIENAHTSKEATALDANAFARRMTENGNTYSKILEKYLNKNANTYPTWKASDNYTDPDAERTSSTYEGDGILGLF